MAAKFKHDVNLSHRITAPKPCENGHEMTKASSGSSKAVTWWIMGLIAAGSMFGASSAITSFYSRVAELERTSNARAERLRSLEVQFEAGDRYASGRDIDLKTRLSRIEEKVDALNLKVSRLP